MPGDLEDPEQMFPFHYDPRYDRTLNFLSPGTFNMDGYLQSIALETIGTKLNPEKLNKIKEKLENKGLFHQNPGEDTFRIKVIQMVKQFKMAKKVAHGRFK